MTAPRDRERSLTYAAEHEADERTPCIDPRPIEELSRLASAVTTHDWWERWVGSRPVTVVAGSSRTSSSYRTDARIIRLGTPHRNTGSLCHELAHATQFDWSPDDVVAHGAEFRGWHVTVRWLLHGRECGDDLQDVYRAYGLDVDVPTAEIPAWTSPVLDPSRYGGLRIVG